MKKVVVAPLNWGLGHASRCIPIIRVLLNSEFTPILASDGVALELLKKEFPSLPTLELPSYQISYGKNLKWNLIQKIPQFLRIAKEEHQVIDEFLTTNTDVVGIISDNRFGVYSSKTPSVYLTHQIHVRAGILTPVTSFFHQRIIKKFDECWIPDEEHSLLSGKLSRSKKKLNQKYIGILSRFQKKDLEQSIDVLIVLSGPEPNRTQLEKKLIKKFYGTNLRICLVQGKIEEQERNIRHGNFQTINFATSETLEELLNASKIVLCRSGYSSILDLAALEKNAVLIPTQGQNEQEYLAQYHQKKNRFVVVKEEDISRFSVDLDFTSSSKTILKKEFDSNLFRLFHGE